jgi:hypothetical protein
MQDDTEILRAAGFTSGSKGALVMIHGPGVYDCYLPMDTRSGKYELTYTQVGERQIVFPPTTQRGVLNWIRRHQTGKV